MAGSGVSWSNCHGHCKQWWRRSLDTCYSTKRILLLLLWQALFSLSWSALLDKTAFNAIVLYSSMFFSFSFAPFIGWLADVRFGRYKVIKFGSIVSFLGSILYYFTMLTGGGDSILSTVLSSLAIVIVGFGSTCYSAAMLPFLTDQIIGATSDELSAVVRWYYWAQYISVGLSQIVSFNESNVISSLFFAVPLAVIIISDCLCQQWLDRTHKVTNPIKLIIQVLNYTRKHRYPERRSAFTYIDEEQPTRMDYGKEKFGGPFTEEEVEDVKTALRLLPLVICLCLSVSIIQGFINVPLFYDYEDNYLLNQGFIYWLFPVLLIPLYQFLLYRCFHSCSPSLLQCIGTGLVIGMLGSSLLSALAVVDVIVSDDVQRYLSCTVLASNATTPGDNVEWYWKIDPYVLFGIGRTLIGVLLLEIIIAQSPDKMKGFVMGIMLAFRGIVIVLRIKLVQLKFTLCYDLSVSLVLVLLFVVFLVLSKRYTLRERNREINIQAIVEEHYERYMDQEEEYIREQHY